MKDQVRLKKLFEDHFDGDPWIEVQILASLRGLQAKDAAKNLYGLNSIWQIVHHMTCWRQTILQRVQGKELRSPSDNYFIVINDVSTAAWTAAVARLKKSQTDLLAYLTNDPGDLDEPAGNKYTRYELLQGLLQHDAYHLGQIVMIKKLLALPGIQ